MLDINPKKSFGLKEPPLIEPAKPIINNNKISIKEMQIPSTLIEPKITISPIIEPPKPDFIGETFDEFKARVFEENFKKLNFLMDTLPEKFVGCSVKKHDGRFIQVYRSGTKLLELFNHEVLYFGNNEFIDFLKEHIPNKIEKPYRNTSL